MAGFKTAFFKGIRPRLSDLKLPEGEGVTATNLKLGSGDLVPWTDVDVGFPIADTFFNKTIYLYDNAGDPKWLEWRNFVSVARGTIKGDTRERIYYTGDGFPKMTYLAIAAQGAEPYPTSFRKLGIPAPGSAPTAVGNELPESLSPSARRVVANTLFTKSFEIAFVNWSVGLYPGTGTATDEWKRSPLSWSGDIYFNFAVGDTMKVIEVIDEDTVLLGSSTGSGAFTETESNTVDARQYNYEQMSNEGSTQVASFVGWRIPDGISVSIVGHLLRVGDIIRASRVDYPLPGGLIFTFHAGESFWEQSWTAPAQVIQGDVTFHQTVNAVVGADAAGEANFNSIDGSFYYDVVREDSEASVLEDRTYVYTYVSALGEEGPPSPASQVIQALDGDAITITGIVEPPTDNYDIVTINLYRTSSTAAGTEYQFVREFSVADLLAGNPLTESKKQINLGAIIESLTWDPPPAGMQGITTMPNGMLVGFVGRTVHMCEPYFPHAWPPEYDQAVGYDIVGLAALGNSIVILTEGIPSVLAGAHPRNASIRPYKIKQACVSAESIASDKDRVVYASPDGLVEISVNGARLITEPYALKAEWDAYSPSTMAGEFHDGKYFGFFDGPDNVPQAPASVAVTGTLSTKAGVVAGGQTVILTLTTDTWLAAGAAFNGSRQDIIDGVTAALNQNLTGWNASVLPNIAVGEVVRTSGTVVTITLAAQAGYSIFQDETISVLVPDSALTGAVALAGDVSLTITPLADYSSKVIAFSEFDSADLDVPFAVISQLDITDWDARAGVGSWAKMETDIDAGAYSPSLDRWLAVGQNSGAALPPNTNFFSTSDDDGVTWTGRTNVYNLFTDTAVGPLAAIWDPLHDTFVVGGANRSLQASPDGEQWTEVPLDLLIPSSSSVREFALSTGGVPDYIYGIVSGANFLIRSPDLKLAPVTNTWITIPITYVSSLGSKDMASGASVIISIGSDNTDMEICSTAQAADSGASVGAVSTYNCRGLTFGNNLWVAISNDFRIVTCASGDQGTIGNWSAPSATKAAGVNIKGITYDGGDGITQGYGYIAYGEITASSLGVIYTSPDASTWTLRHTAVPTIDIDAVAVKYPESNLGDAETAFAPTYNGARIPTLIGDTLADYEDLAEAFTRATAQTNIAIEITASDAIIRLSGVESGDTGDDNGSSAQATVDPLFNLNVQPDSISIASSESITTLTGTWTGPVGVGVQPIFGVAPIPTPYGRGEFVDDQFFVPLEGFEYGYQAIANLQISGIPTVPSDITNNGVITTEITFTFRKEGYQDLAVTYKIRATANTHVNYS